MSIAKVIPNVSRIVRDTLPSYFSRRGGKLGPARTFLILFNMTIFGRRGYRRIIKDLLAGAVSCEPLWDERDGAPSAAAICKARKKISREQCADVFHNVYEACTIARRRPRKKFKNLQICLFDGSNVSLPVSKELSKTFGHPSNAQGKSPHPMAGLMLLWNASTQQPIAFTLSPYAQNERAQARSLFDKIPPRSLIITDRGMAGFSIFRELHEREQPFIIRMKNSHYGDLSDHIDTHGNDCLYTCRARNEKGRLIPGPGNEIQIRLISLRLASGEREVLATNLWADDGHKAKEIEKLYVTRWNIETAFKDMKVDLALESFSAKHVKGIYQEIYAILIFVLLQAELDAYARIQAKVPTKKCDANGAYEEYQFHKTMMMDAVHGVLQRINRPQKEIKKFLKIMLTEIYRYKTMVRPGRVFPRNHKYKK